MTFHSEGKILENVNYKQDLKLFSNYLDKPTNIDLDYLLEIDLDINPFLSTQLIMQFIYDDNSNARLQIREIIVLGVKNKLK